mmetsp:Transcript_7597/g.12766  ORF Transcript_7597/g.12766 Transcript_7597/m.12766 type:complete len:328 (-) Transcript_7597:970-1953(-)
MLFTYVMPEIKSEYPVMRMRACQVYGVYGTDIKYKVENHISDLAQGVFSNMEQGQPLPVKFHAACALEKILRNEEAMKLIRPGLDVVLKTYLQLMTEFDNEELVASFENLMTIFEDEIGPYACDICEHLKQQYTRLIKQDAEGAEDDDGETILTAVANFTSIRRIIVAIKDDSELLRKVETIVYPCLLHSLTADGLDSIEEGVDSIAMIIHSGYKNEPSLSPNLWKMYPLLLYVCAGDDGDMEGGYGFEFVSQICLAIKNYISRDPEGMLRVGEDQEKSFLHLTYHFLTRCLKVNRNSSDMMDGIAVVGVIISLFEDMHGRLDQDFP